MVEKWFVCILVFRSRIWWISVATFTRMWAVYGCLCWRRWYMLVLMTPGWWITTVTVIATGFPRWTMCWYFKWIIFLFCLFWFLVYFSLQHCHVHLKVCWFWFWIWFLWLFFCLCLFNETRRFYKWIWNCRIYKSHCFSY